MINRNVMRFAGLVFIASCVPAGAGPGDALGALERQSLQLVRSTCDSLSIGPITGLPEVDGVAPEVSSIMLRGETVGERFVYRFNAGRSLRIDILGRGGRPPRLVAETRHANRPQFFVATDTSCNVREMRRLVYDEADDSAIKVSLLDENGDEIDNELLNPPAPVVASGSGTPADTLRVAMVDSGVNYLLPEIVSGLARDASGKVVGYDFWDGDSLPFDAHTAASPFFVQRHGTRTASLLLRDAGPGVELVSYRYPRPDMDRMADLITHADGLGVRVIGMPLGSNRLADWEAFRNAAAARPHILFVVSAGNGGRDIDRQPVYPAALGLNNMIVVSSADDFAGVAERVNQGAQSVDYLLPAERQPVLDYSGRDELASGSSYAVARMVAMAARLLKLDPSLDRVALMKAIDGYRQPTRRQGLVARGYIPDPRAPGQKIDFVQLAEPKASYGHGDSQVALQLVYLDSRWNREEVVAALSEAAAILSQCDAGFGPVSSALFDGPDYLLDLETGAAHTLLSALPDPAANDAVRLVFARDTRMAVQFEAEAFGAGNTRSRPWLNKSVWIAFGAPDLGLTIAHELYHVLANDGRHLPGNDNLMAAETSAGRSALTEAQCAQMR